MRGATDVAECILIHGAAHALQKRCREFRDSLEARYRFKGVSLQTSESPQSQDYPDGSETNRFRLLISYLEDARTRAEVTKTRCWNGFLWTVSMNLVMAAVSVFIQRPSRVLLLCALVSASTGAIFLWHHTLRLERFREVEQRIARHLNKTVFDVTLITVTGWRSVRQRQKNDRFELFGFWIAIAISILPVIAATFLTR